MRLFLIILNNLECQTDLRKASLASDAADKPLGLLAFHLMSSDTEFEAYQRKEIQPCLFR